jgi:tetratricopeptide (TPR) repeat protein
MAEAPTLLKVLLTERHMQPYPTFCREYEKAAHRIDPALVATAPGREQYQRWLSGQVKTKPHPHHCRVLERMFPGRTVVELFTPYNQPEQGSAHDKESVTERRRLCQLGGTAMAGALFDRLWTEPARMHEALDATTVSPARLADLQREAAGLGVRVVRVPPATLVEETLMRFREARKLAAKKQNCAMQREIVRCAAMYAIVMGEILFNEGHFSLAHTWYAVARRAALEAGDQYLADIAMAGNTYLATYAPDPRAVLAAVDPRLESKHAASPAIAWLWGFKAKAHAMLGDRDLFELAINKSHQALEASSPDLVQPGIFSFLPEKLAFYEARGLVELGRTEEASAAAERAIALYDFSETTEPALVRFEQASAFAQAGEIQEACRVATDAVLDRRTYHGVTVITRAREFDLLLGPSNCEATRDWRELLASVRPPQLALAAATEESV